MQRLLENDPDLDVAVLAVWEPSYQGAREFWDGNLLRDERVREYWDESRAVGNWYGRRDGTGFSYDVYYLYGPNGELQQRPIDSGRPVVSQIARLRAELERAA